MPNTPIIPENITVHLGTPESPAQNVTLSFIDYIKNVASSEIYPTWPESALIANIRAQISYALNRVYTEYYPSRGYNFDITSTTAYDQSFVNGRDIFENISELVDRIFDSYIRRDGFVEPLFASYCDGVETQCSGLSQWGTVDLAERGLTPLEILEYYYGDDISIVENVPIGTVEPSAPPFNLRLGSAGPDVQRLQIRLNRISGNFSGIPKIYPTDGVFGVETENAVKVFQEVFSLTPDGIVGNATWYKIQNIYNGVKKLASLNSEGLTLDELSTQYPSELALGDTGVGVRVVQYYLAYIAEYVSTIPEVTVDGAFGRNTEEAVRAFQSAYGLPVDGIVGEVTWNKIYNTYLGIIAAIPIKYTQGITIPFPGTILKLGSEGADVRVMQEYLNYISTTYSEIPTGTADGIFGVNTQNSVIAFQDLLGLSGARGVVNSNVWDAITDVYEDLWAGNAAEEGQFPGYTIE